MTKGQAVLAALGAAAVLTTTLHTASAQSRPAQVRWENRCAFSSDQSLQGLQRLFTALGLDGWELAAVWPDLQRRTDEGIERITVVGINYCFKRPLADAPAPSPPPVPAPNVLPTERALVAALGNTRSLLTACRDTYARNITQLSIAVTVAPSGQVQDATLSGAAGNGQLSDCVERSLKLVTLPRFHGVPTVVRTTLTLPIIPAQGR